MSGTVTLTSPLGSVTLYTANQYRDGAFQAGAQFFHDWYTLSDSKTEIRERAAADGAFGIDRDWRSSLPLNLTGRFRGATWGQMLMSLRAVLSAGTPVTVTVDDAIGVSSRIVSVRHFEPSPNPGAQYVEFQAVLVATDARMFGPTQTATATPPTSGTGQAWPQVFPVDWGTPGGDGRASAANGGSAVSPLTMTVTGGADGVELVETTSGRILRLERFIPVGATVVFDADAGAVYLEVPENDLTGFMTRREWDGFQIAPFGSRTVQFNPLGTMVGSPLLTLVWADAN
ncbi:MAG: hypothetical protein J0H96_05655 [Microbacterium ginsengisoli]|nr:hypothetical protein [Microbacterium ginsengisoli]